MAIPMHERLLVAVAHSKAVVPLSARSRQKLSGNGAPHGGQFKVTPRVAESGQSLSRRAETLEVAPRQINANVVAVLYAPRQTHLATVFPCSLSTVIRNYGDVLRCRNLPAWARRFLSLVRRT